MNKIVMIVSFIVTILITGCTKKPSPEEIKAYELRKEKANGFRIYGTIDKRLRAYALSTFRSTADPDKLKECSTYNTLYASRRRFLDYEIQSIEETNFDIKIPIEYISKEDKCGMEYVDTEIKIYRKGDKGEKDEGPLLSTWVLFSTLRVKGTMVTNYDKDKYINGKLVKKGEEYFRKGRADIALHNPEGFGNGLVFSPPKANLFYHTKKKYFFLNNKLEFKCHTYFRKSIVKGQYSKRLICYPINFKQAKGIDEIPKGTMDIELHIGIDQSNNKKGQPFLTYEMQKELK